MPSSTRPARATAMEHHLAPHLLSLSRAEKSAYIKKVLVK